MKELEAEADGQAQVVADTLEEISSAKDPEALKDIEIDESLSEENKAILDKAIADKKIELEKIETDKKAESDRQTKVVTETKKSIEEATSVETLEAIEIDKSLSKENQTKLETAKEGRKAELEKIEADKLAAKTVEDQILALGEITLESKDTVEAASVAFDKLLDEQKELVDLDTITRLADALEALEELEDSDKELKEGFLMELKTLIDELKRLELDAIKYEGLDKESSITDIKVAIGEINKILGDIQDKDQAIIAELDKYKKEIIEKIDSVTSIEDLKGKIKAILKDSEVKFEVIEAEYEGSIEYEVILSKNYIERKFILSGELPKTEDERIAKEAEEKISNLPEEISLDSKDIVEAARAAYDILTEDQKSLVTNLEALEAAENKLIELKKDLEYVNESIEKIQEKLKEDKVYRNKYRVEEALKGIKLDIKITIDTNGTIFVEKGNIKKSIEVKLAEKEEKDEVIKKVKETGKTARLKVLEKGSLAPYFNVIEVTEQVTIVSISEGKDNTSLGILGKDKLPTSGTLGVVAIKDMADLETVDILIVNGTEFSLVGKEDKTHADIKWDGFSLIASAKPSGVKKLGDAVGQEISIVLRGYEFGEIKHTIKIVER